MSSTPLTRSAKWPVTRLLGKGGYGKLGHREAGGPLTYFFVYLLGRGFGQRGSLRSYLLWGGGSLGRKPWTHMSFGFCSCGA